MIHSRFVLCNYTTRHPYYDKLWIAHLRVTMSDPDTNESPFTSPTYNTNEKAIEANLSELATSSDSDNASIMPKMLPASSFVLHDCSQVGSTSDAEEQKEAWKYAHVRYTYCRCSGSLWDEVRRWCFKKVQQVPQPVCLQRTLHELLMYM